MSQLLKYGVPQPFAAEAPSAWISRLAVAQGCTLGELSEFLELDPRDDVDWALSLRGFAEFRRRCSLGPEAFAVAERVLSNLRVAGVSDQTYLRCSNVDRAAFGYCPKCLAVRGECYLPIHWRFKDWRYCPVHHCLLDEVCGQCLAPLVHPRSLVASTAGRQGHASLRHCLDCAANLGRMSPCPVSDGPVAVLSQLERCWLKNGRALLAGLHQGYFQLGGTRLRLTALDYLHDQAVLPTELQGKSLERRLRRALRPVK